MLALSKLRGRRAAPTTNTSAMQCAARWLRHLGAAKLGTCERKFLAAVGRTFWSNLSATAKSAAPSCGPGAPTAVEGGVKVSILL